MNAAAAVLLPLSFPLLFISAAGANQRQQTICCRTSGGTRGTCLNLWAHLVPVSNRFDPGSSRLIALLQGPSANPESMRVQVSRLAGQVLVDQTLPAQGASVWLLTLPKTNLREVASPLLWESFPTCHPNRPPTRTVLQLDSTAKAASSPSLLSNLNNLCGKEVATTALLRTFGLEEWTGKLPVSLPVHCQSLSSGDGVAPPANGAKP